MTDPVVRRSEVRRSRVRFSDEHKGMRGSRRGLWTGDFKKGVYSHVSHKHFRSQRSQSLRGVSLKVSVSFSNRKERLSVVVVPYFGVSNARPRRRRLPDCPFRPVPI